MRMERTNVEIKARCSDHDAVRTVLQEHEARKKGVDRQIDTYFNVPNGRLKLREGDIEQYLVHYNRGDRKGPKQSDIRLYEPTDDPAALKAALEAALDVDVVVKKTREIYFVDNVKFQLDDVDGLGKFVEIEAIDRDGSTGTDRLEEQCRTYMGVFPIDDDDLVDVSYSDLVRQR